MSDVTRHARISDDGQYRYMLAHVWDLNTLPICWIMLNPSTADAKQDDATIRTVTWWTRKFGAGGFVVVNLFALRSTDPKGLFAAADPVGPDNAGWIQRAVELCPRILCAWGASPKPEGGLLPALQILWYAQGKKIYCLGKTKDGHPRHPLYVKRNTVPEPFL